MGANLDVPDVLRGRRGPGAEIWPQHHIADDVPISMADNKALKKKAKKSASFCGGVGGGDEVGHIEHDRLRRTVPKLSPSPEYSAGGSGSKVKTMHEFFSRFISELSSTKI